MGTGHRSTANALQALIEERELPYQVQVVELFKEVFGTGVRQFIYNNIILKYKWAQKINDPIMIPLFKLQINFYRPIWLKHLRKFWRKSQPDLVVSLLPLVNQLLYESLQSELPSIPFMTSITDFADSPPHFWIEPQEQLLICPSRKTVKQAKSLGYQDKNIVRTSGLIVNPRFYQPQNLDRRIERQRLGLHPDLPTAIVMFGGEGTKVMWQIAEYLEQTSLNIQLIFMCGHNEKLANRLRNNQNRLPKYVKTFTDDIAYYMHLSDFFIGKPGNVSISEAMVMKLPIITECNALTLAQERGCAEWIANNQTGIVINNFRNIEGAIKELLQPENYSRYRNNIDFYNNRAVFEVVDLLERNLESLNKQPKTGLVLNR